MHHPNRFVRETAHFTAASMCEALAGPRLLGIGQELAERLADGLSDNWSQVRQQQHHHTLLHTCSHTPDLDSPAV